MRKNAFSVWTVASAVVMILLPFLAVTVVNGDAGMAICFLLFYIVNPIYSVLLGGFAGRDAQALWGLPFVSAALFLLGCGVLFTLSEPLFFWYAAAYLGLGLLALLISAFIKKRGSA